MSTIVRVKRRASEESPNALVIARKRQKLEGEGEEVKNVFRLAVTVSNKDEPLAQHLKNALHKDELKAEYKTHSGNRKEKARNERKQIVKNNRYKIVNSLRCNSEAGAASDALEELSHIFDIEPELEDVQPKKEEKKDLGDGITCNGQAMRVETRDDYVYDIYYAHDPITFKEDDLLSIEAFESDLVSLSDCRDYDAICDEDEDSNEEGNYRNEYPDTEEEGEGDSDRELRYYDDSLDIEESFLKCKITEDSDEESEETFGPHYGLSYTQYKAKVMKELNMK